MQTKPVGTTKVIKSRGAQSLPGAGMQVAMGRQSEVLASKMSAAGGPQECSRRGARCHRARRPGWMGPAPRWTGGTKAYPSPGSSASSKGHQHANRKVASKARSETHFYLLVPSQVRNASSLPKKPLCLFDASSILSDHLWASHSLVLKDLIRLPFISLY